MKVSRQFAYLLLAASFFPASHSQQSRGQLSPPPAITLVGTVIQSPPGLSIALVAVNGRTEAPYFVGSAIADSWLLAAASADEILISSRDGRTATVRISADPTSTAVPPVVASAPAPVAAALPQRSPTFPTPEMVEAAINEFNSPEND